MLSAKHGDEMSDRSDAFVKAWVSDNVHSIPRLEDYSGEISALVRQLISEAEAAGIGGDELVEAVGDADDYMTSAFQQVQDGELGFRTSDAA
jgi:hypothetical protein